MAKTSLLPMNQSNIFVYIELSKLAAGLTQPDKEAKRCLKAQAGYFNIIDPKYFSDSLADEWKNITMQIRKQGPSLSNDGQVRANALVNTIDQMSAQECTDLINRIIALHEKVKLEFKNESQSA
jgi:hypothetical protein